jgi:hypothetical protein
MNKQLLVAALAGAFAAMAVAQTSDSPAMDQDSAKAAIEAGADSSVNTQTTAAQQQANTAASSQITAPTDADRAKALAPMMEIQSWQAGAAAAKGASDAAASAQLPPQRVQLGAPETAKALEQAATQ